MSDASLIDRVHERLDALFQSNSKIEAAIERIEQRCGPCQELLQAHQRSLHGNGREGLMVRMAAAEVGRVDTLSVKSAIALLTSIGALAATIGACMATLVK